jgi:hypothetical protein
LWESFKIIEMLVRCYGNWSKVDRGCQDLGLEKNIRIEARKFLLARRAASHTSAAKSKKERMV